MTTPFQQRPPVQPRQPVQPRPCAACARRGFPSTHNQWAKYKNGTFVCREMYASELHKQNKANQCGKLCEYCIFIGRPFEECITHFERETSRHCSKMTCPHFLEQHEKERKEKEARRLADFHYEKELEAYEERTKKSSDPPRRIPGRYEQGILDGFARGDSDDDELPVKFEDSDFPSLSMSSPSPKKKPQWKSLPPKVTAAKVIKIALEIEEPPEEPVFEPEETIFGPFSLHKYNVWIEKQKQARFEKRMKRGDFDDDFF
jgi:hypothetical protein